MAGLHLNIISLPSKLDKIKAADRVALEGLPTDIQLLTGLEASCERFDGDIDDDLQSQWWASDTTPKQQPSPFNRMFVFKNKDNEIYQAHIHINSNLLNTRFKFHEFVRLTEALPDSCELHVFFACSLNVFEVGALISALKRTKARVISHIINITGLATLVAAFTADEVKVSQFSIICLSHHDERIGGMEAKDLLNCAAYVKKRREDYTMQLFNCGLLSAEEADDFINKDIILSLQGELLTNRVANAKTLK